MDEKQEHRDQHEHHEHSEEKVSKGTILLHDMVRGARKYWWALAMVVAVCACLGLLAGIKAYQPMYKAEATFTVETMDDNSGYSFFYDNQTAAQMALTFPYLLDSDLLMDRVKADLGVDYVNGSPSAETTENSNLFTLTVTSNDPQDAYDILLAVMDNYPDVSQYVIGRNKLNIITLPEVPTQPYNDNRRPITTAAGGLIGVLLCGLLLVLYALSRNTVRQESDVHRWLNTTCLGCVPLVIPKRYRKARTMDLSITNDKTGEAFSESLRRTALYAKKQMGDGQVLLITATTVGEGVTLAARNIAIALSETGKRVLYVDGHLIDGGSTYGWERYLLDIATFEQVIQQESASLYVTGCSEGISRRDLSRMRLHAFMEEAKQAVDYIVIDAPSCQHLEQISPLLEEADAVAYVVRQDEVKVHRILACFEDLTQYDAPLIGCIFNGVAGGLGGYGYHYSYGYGYRYGSYGYRHHYGHYGRYGYGYRYGSRKDKEETT